MCHFLSLTCTIKSCIKAAAYMQFFNVLVQLLFKRGFYSRVAYTQFSDFAKLVKAVWHKVTCTAKANLDFVNVTKFFQNVNKHFGMQKAVEFCLPRTILGRHFQAAASI